METTPQSPLEQLVPSTRAPSAEPLEIGHWTYLNNHPSQRHWPRPQEQAELSLPGTAQAPTCSKASWSSTKHNWSAIWNLVFHGLSLHHSATGQSRAGEWEPRGSKRNLPHPPHRQQRGAEGSVPSEIAWLGLKDQPEPSHHISPMHRFGQLDWYTPTTGKGHNRLQFCLHSAGINWADWV